MVINIPRDGVFWNLARLFVGISIQSSPVNFFSADFTPPMKEFPTDFAVRNWFSAAPTAENLPRPGLCGSRAYENPAGGCLIVARRSKTERKLIEGRTSAFPIAGSAAAFLG
jgi:hypothetical protein